MKILITRSHIVCFLPKAMGSYTPSTLKQAILVLKQPTDEILGVLMKTNLASKMDMLNLRLSTDRPHVNQTPIARTNREKQTPGKAAAVSYMEA